MGGTRCRADRGRTPLSECSASFTLQPPISGTFCATRFPSEGPQVSLTVHRCKARKYDTGEGTVPPLIHRSGPAQPLPPRPRLPRYTLHALHPSFANRHTHTDATTDSALVELDAIRLCPPPPPLTDSGPVPVPVPVPVPLLPPLPLPLPLPPPPTLPTLHDDRYANGAPSLTSYTTPSPGPATPPSPSSGKRTNGVMPEGVGEPLMSSRLG